LFAYTSILKINELTEENTRQVPFFAQQAISEKTDIRVTVVGTSVWAHKILVNGEDTDGDWRLNKRDSLTYEPVGLPHEIEEKCIDLCKRLDLRFGGIDLMKTQDRYYFVEVNPTGEWAWLPGAAQTSAPAIADYLIHGHDTERSL